MFQLDYAVKYGLVRKAGAWFSLYNEDGCTCTVAPLIDTAGSAFASLFCSLVCVACFVCG